jgi:hypothetical protein
MYSKDVTQDAYIAIVLSIVAGSYHSSSIFLTKFVMNIIAAVEVGIDEEKKHHK